MRIAVTNEAPTFLGIDVGSTNTKVSLVAVDENECVRELVVVSLPTPDEAGGLVETVAVLIGKALIGGHRPEAVGIASMAETGVPLDADGQPLSDLVRWNGVSGNASEPLLRGLGRVPLFEATGVQPRAKAPLSMWESLRRTRPELWSRMARWSGAADLIGLSLTGHLVTDHTLAGRTMAYRLPPQAAPLPAGFDADLLAAVGMEPSQLPAVAQPGAAAGMVTSEAAARTGLLQGTPVVIAGHDHAVAAWAGGVRKPAHLADSIGTTEALIQVLADPVDRRETAATGMGLTRSVTGEHESLLAGSANGGALIRWWLEDRGVTDAGDVFSSALSTSPEKTDLLVLPYRFGRQTPFPDFDATLEALDPGGQRVDFNRGGTAAAARALLEGMVFHLRWMASAQRKITTQDAAKTLTVLGGGGPASPLWLALKSAILPLPILTAASAEPVATGAALLAGVRLGILPADVGLPLEPVPPAPDRLAEHYHNKYLAFIKSATKTHEENHGTS